MNLRNILIFLCFSSEPSFIKNMVCTVSVPNRTGVGNDSHVGTGLNKT